MTLTEARKILGLGYEDDPRPFLGEFQEARERIAEMVRNAPNETLAMRYQQGLMDFDQALAVVREQLEAAGLIPRGPRIPEVRIPQVEIPAVSVPAVELPPIGLPEEIPAAEIPVPPPVPETPPAPAPAATAAPAFVFPKSRPNPFDPSPQPPPLPVFIPEKTAPILAKTVPEYRPRARNSNGIIWLLVVILLGIAGGFLYLKNEEEKRINNQKRVVFLERQGAIFIENRRWPDATKAFDEIESLSPKSEVVALGRRSIEAGMAEEQSQFVGYWTGQARVSLETKRFDEAEAAARQVLDKFPKEKEAAELLSQVAAARSMESDRTTLVTAREELQQRKWDAAIATATKVLAKRPDDEDAKLLLSDASTAKEKAAADLLKAKSLLAQAKARDQGQFDANVIAWVREANSLAPEDPDIQAYMEKIAGYARTLRVPGDFATPAEALAQARDRDRIVIAAGTWQGPLIVNASVDLQGAGPDNTTVQCPARDGNAITLGPGAKGARITGISFRHLSFDPGVERFSTALVRGVTADFVDCRFFEGSGHGLAVIEGGHAIVSRCRFSDNGWDGVAASGPGSLLEVRQSESLRNFGHGIESWDGAAVILSGNRCEDNSRNGIHADNGGGSVTIEKNQLTGNREFGMVLGSAGSGKVSENIARENLLGGFAIRATASAVSFVSNEAHKNDGPGLVLDLGLIAATYASNISTGNAGQQVLTNANLTVKDPLPADDTIAPATPPRAKPVTKSR